MQQILQPLINKAQLVGLEINVTKAGLCIGDTAQMKVFDDGEIGVFAVIRSRWLGLLPIRRLQRLGRMGPTARAILTEPLRRAMHLRVRIVGLTPEHLAASRQPEVFVSVWATLDPALGVTPAAADQGAYRT